jgi:hypothetical protein
VRPVKVGTSSHRAGSKLPLGLEYWPGDTVVAEDSEILTDPRAVLDCEFVAALANLVV